MIWLLSHLIAIWPVIIEKCWLFIVCCASIIHRFTRKTLSFECFKNGKYIYYEMNLPWTRTQNTERHNKMSHKVIYLNLLAEIVAVILSIDTPTGHIGFSDNQLFYFDYYNFCRFLSSHCKYCVPLFTRHLQALAVIRIRTPTNLSTKEMSYRNGKLFRLISGGKFVDCHRNGIPDGCYLHWFSVRMYCQRL